MMVSDETAGVQTAAQEYMTAADITGALDGPVSGYRIRPGDVSLAWARLSAPVAPAAEVRWLDLASRVVRTVRDSGATTAAIRAALDAAAKAAKVRLSRGQIVHIMTGDPIGHAFGDPAAVVGEIEDGGRLVRFAGATYQYRDGRYVQRGADWLLTECRRVLERHAKRIKDQSGVVIDGIPTLAATAVGWAEAVLRIDFDHSALPVGVIFVRDTDGAGLREYRQAGTLTDYIVTADGVLSYRERVLEPHTPDLFGVSMIPHRLTRSGTAPGADHELTDADLVPVSTKWVKFLERMVPDAESRQYLAHMAGAMLAPGLPWQYYSVMLGSGSNGKGVFVGRIRQMLGSANVTALRLDELRAGSFAMADLVGKLANIPGDEPDAGHIDEAAIKTLTGGDTITVQRKYLPGLTFVPTAKILVCCNVLPAIRDTSYGTARRRVTVEWPVRVSADEADPAMSTDAYWAEEMPGILRWAYDGLIDLLARDGRPVIPTASRDTTEEQMELSHESWRWLARHYEFTGCERDRVPSADLYAAYMAEERAQATGAKPITTVRFAAEVKGRFPGLNATKSCKIGGAVVRCWIGLRSRTPGLSRPVE